MIRGTMGRPLKGGDTLGLHSHPLAVPRKYLWPDTEVEATADEADNRTHA